MSLLLIIFACCTGSLLAALVGLVGSKRHIGFGWSFLLSVIFTPLIGLIFVLISDPLPTGERKWGCLGATLGFLTVVALFTVLCLMLTGCSKAPNTNPEIERIDSAVVVAAQTHRQVLCQMGGDWCKWCRKLNEEIAADSTLAQFINENYVYIHVLYVGKDDVPSQELNERLNNAARFGFPAWVILDGKGEIVHIQNTEYLESGFGYDHQRILECLEDWK